MEAKSAISVVTMAIALFFCTIQLYAKDLSDYHWMSLFNQGKYDSVVNQILPMVHTLDSDMQGVPIYFLGESYYNLGLLENNAQRSQINFRKSLKSFKECLTHVDLKVSEYRYMAQYKKGWAQFRLAELDEQNDVKLFGDAFNSFESIEGQAPADLQLYGSYMAGEARLRQALIMCYKAFSHNALVSEINSILGLLQEARTKFQFVSEKKQGVEDLQVAATIRVNDVYYQLGKVYQCLNPALFSGVNDGNKTSSCQATAKYYFSHADYEGLSKTFSPSINKKIGSLLAYSEAMTLLNAYLTQVDDKVSFRFSEKINELEKESYASEKLFRKGNRDQANEILDSGVFLNLSMDESYYAKAALAIPESYYWYGFVQSIFPARHKSALDNFESYLKKVGSKPLDTRQRLLWEDAMLRKYSLDLNRIMQMKKAGGKQKLLKSLEQSLIDFQPRMMRIQSQKEKLLARVRISIEIVKGETDTDDEIAGRIYSTILGRNVGVAEDLMKELLPQAASTIGRSRDSYLKVLKILAMILEENEPDKSKFYSGVSLSLEAEISPTQDEKTKLFKQAAAILASVGGQYKKEAEYIQARSLFLAESNKSAVSLLSELINNDQSLRALFYLAEYYRINQNSRAAKKCYQSIMDKTRGISGAAYWFRNAQAALTLCRSEGNEADLKDINYKNVTFPDVFLKDADGNVVSYEGLADYKYLQTRLALEAKDLLVKFGLPKRTIYPSLNRIKNSQIIANGVFSEIAAPINEMRGPITSSLHLSIVAPSDIDRDLFRVTLADELLQPDGENMYIKDRIQLNTTALIRVEGEGFYPFVENHIFKKSGVDSIFIVPSLRLQFISKGKEKFEKANAVYFDTRFDQNIILNATASKLPKDSKMYQEMSLNPSYRDFIYHPQLEAYLVVDAARNRIARVPSPEMSIEDAGDFEIDLGDSQIGLNSPDGIAVDSEGNVYIADWGNNRLLVTKMNGAYLMSIGAPDNSDRRTNSISLIFPTRIAIAEDTEGVIFKGEKKFGQRLIYVADRNGVHLFDERGQYLDTVIHPFDAFPVGVFYGLRVDGYGKKSMILLADRNSNKVIKFGAILGKR